MAFRRIFDQRKANSLGFWNRDDTGAKTVAGGLKKMIEQNKWIFVLAVGFAVFLANSSTGTAQNPCDGFASNGDVTAWGTCRTVPIAMVPPSFSVNSDTFPVANVGTLVTVVTLKTYPASAGRSKYRISVRRGMPGSNALYPGGIEVATAELIADGTGKESRFSIPLASCSVTGSYHVRITNTSTENPQLAEAKVYYGYPFLDRRDLDMQGDTFSLDPSSEATRTIGSFTKQGTIFLKAKWHVPGLLPSYAKLRISLLRPDNTVARDAKDYYSIHYREGTPQFSIVHFVSARDTGQTGQWKLKIVNTSTSKIENFNIEKGLDLNPFVPYFKSFFDNGCTS